MGDANTVDDVEPRIAASPNPSTPRPRSKGRTPHAARGVIVVTVISASARNHWRMRVIVTSSGRLLLGYLRLFRLRSVLVYRDACVREERGQLLASAVT